MYLAVNNLQWLICHKTKPNQTKSYLMYVYQEDLVLNNPQRVICHKTQPNRFQIRVELKVISMKVYLTSPELVLPSNAV